MKMDVNSLFYWWPLIKELDIPMPKTTLIRYEGSTLEADSEEWQEFIVKVRKVCDEYGYPLFIRCGGLSGKHDWKDTCYVDSPEKISQNAHNILICVLMVMSTRLDFDGIAVRELLELESRFTAFGGAMPIAKEFRFFARNGEYECHHPYWPPTAIYMPSIDNWYEELKDMQKLAADELTLLKGYAVTIAQELDKGELGHGWWSMDFCKTVDGTWYLTDLATGKESYHWNTCPYAPEHMKDRTSPEDPEKLAEIHGPTGRAERLRKLKERYGID